MLTIKVENTDVYTAEFPGVTVHRWQLVAFTDVREYRAEGKTLAEALAAIESMVIRK